MAEQIDWTQVEVCLAAKSSDWKRREEDLGMLIARIDAGDAIAIDFVARNSKSMALQLNDLRSALVKLASMVIEKAARVAAEAQLGGMEKFADAFLRDANLIKALGSANKVINIHAATAFRALFEASQVSLAALEAFFAANRDSKSISVRERLADGLAIYIAALGRAKERKVKAEGIGFLKKAAESLLKDASGNVRTAAKRAVCALEKLEDALLGIDSAHMEEESGETRTRSRSREGKPHATLPMCIEKSKTMPIPRRETSKGMEIENDDTQPLRHSDFGCAKKEKKKVKGEGVLEVLENPKKQIREKIDTIGKMDLEDFYTGSDSDEFKRLLAQFQCAKNFELKKLIIRLIEGVRVGKFMGALLNYTEKERLDKKLNYSFFITRLLQEPIAEFIEFFLARNNSFALKLLQKRFDAEHFDALVRDNADMLQSLMTVISQNVTQEGTENFAKLNFALLESICQCSAVAAQQKSLHFSDAFLAKLEPHNPELFKFLQDQKRRLGDKVVFKPSNSNNDNKLQVSKLPVLLKPESRINRLKAEDRPIGQLNATKPGPLAMVEEPDSADVRLEALMGKASSQTKKTVIKTILAHLKGLQANKEPFSAEKIFNKTLEVLRCTLEADDMDDELVESSYRLIAEMHCMFDRDKLKCMSLYDSLLDISKHCPDFRDRVADLIVKGQLRVKFFAHVLMCINGGDNATVLEGVRLLTSMLRLGKESCNYMIFKREFGKLQADTATVMRELCAHAETSVRKSVVHFMVACHFFADASAFQKMIDQFSLDQQKLVELYIKKAES